MQAWPIVLALIAAAVLLASTRRRANAGSVPVGAPAPDFRLQDQAGAWHTPAGHRGRWITLYFYPKDETPGCTKEACAFRDDAAAFSAIGAVVLGVSLDDVKSHEKFTRRQGLPFPLLADTEGVVARQYGVLKNFGLFRMAGRETFLIDPEGRIARHYDRVKPAGHPAEVLADIRSLTDARRAD